MAWYTLVLRFEASNQVVRRPFGFMVPTRADCITSVVKPEKHRLIDCSPSRQRRGDPITHHVPRAQLPISSRSGSVYPEEADRRGPQSAQSAEPYLWLATAAAGLTISSISYPSIGWGGQGSLASPACAPGVLFVKLGKYDPNAP